MPRDLPEIGSSTSRAVRLSSVPTAMNALGFDRSVQDILRSRVKRRCSETFYSRNIDTMFPPRDGLARKKRPKPWTPRSFGVSPLELIVMLTVLYSITNG